MFVDTVSRMGLKFINEKKTEGLSRDPRLYADE